MNRLSRGGKPTSPCIVPARAQSFNCGPTGRWGGHRSTGDSKLSHCCMFLNHTSVLRHIPATKPWQTWASGRSKWRPGPGRRLGRHGRRAGAGRGGAGAGRSTAAGRWRAGKNPTHRLMPCRMLCMYPHSWSGGLDSLAVCIRFRVQFLRLCTFFLNVLYLHILAYTVIYRHIPAYT